MSVAIAHALSVRSDFSLGESSLRIEKAIERAKELGYQSIALVDNMTISGMVDLFNKATAAGLKPIIGCTLRVFDDPTYKPPKKNEGGVLKENLSYRLKAYALSDKGVESLFELLSTGYREDHFYYVPRVGLEEALQLKDVAITTGDFFNVFHHPNYKTIVADLMNVFRDNFYVEFVPINTPLFDTLNERAAEVLHLYGLNSLATYPALYEPGAADSTDVLRAIASNNKMTDPWMQIPYIRDFELHEPIELVKRLVALQKRIDRHIDVKGALKGTADLVSKANFEFKKRPPCLPVMAPDEFAALVKEVKDGWTARFSAPVLGHVPSPHELVAYKERLKFELDTLRKMGFSGYFLLVQDIVRWAKSNGIMVGPGRGSVGGSLVAYLMGITDVDPLRFNLLFERFINPERIDLPDADLDFMSTRRHEVIEYVTNKYGADRVAGISNYGTLGPASALRDVSRVHSLDPLEYACSKQMEKEHGVSLSLEESAAVVPDIDKFKNKYPTIWKHATTLEGVMRNLGRHAAGVVVAGEPLHKRAVVETRTGGPVVNWDKRIVEEWGLIKMDILGLSTLDTLSLARQYVNEFYKTEIDYLSLPLDDQEVLKAFAEGDTTGVFQFESHGMRKLLKELAYGGSLTFDDLVAATALFRPGPLDAGLCDEYVQIKQGAKVAYYEHPLMEPALKQTHGVIIYQEQIMQICRDLAGFTMAEADHVRKAMGKKDKEKMAEWRERFIAGAKTNGMDEISASALWEKIEVFAGYAFNKSHSVEYTIISWWTMWVKVYYPAAFYAAAMTITDNDEKLAGLVLDARKKGIEILPPNINRSSGRIEIMSATELLAPFNAVKGVGESCWRALLELRETDGPFTSAAHLQALVSERKLGRKINKTHIANLQRVGAFFEVEGGVHPLHADRLKDRIELMPGFTVDSAKAARGMNADVVARNRIIRLSQEFATCEGCSLKGKPHPVPRIGGAPKVMLVFDNPTYPEERSGKLFEGDGAGYMKAAMKDAGLSVNDVYVTTLVKAGKLKGAKGLTNEQINGCSGYLMQEIEILKPPVIVAMGPNSIRFFAPGVKGGPAELAGKVIFDPKLDASIVFGLNPSSILFDPSKVALLQSVCEKIADLVS